MPSQTSSLQVMLGAGTQDTEIKNKKVWISALDDFVVGERAPLEKLTKLIKY